MSRLLFFILALCTFIFGYSHTIFGQSSALKTGLVNAVLVRPNNGTAYAASDVVADTSAKPGMFLVFRFVARDYEGTGYITGARIFTDTANVANGTFRLYVYNDSVGVAQIADNAAYTTIFADRSKILGFIDFTLALEGAGSTGAMDAKRDLKIAYSTIKASRALYGVIVAKAAYVPKTFGKFFIELTVDRN